MIYPGLAGVGPPLPTWRRLRLPAPHDQRGVSAIKEWCAPAEAGAHKKLIASSNRKCRIVNELRQQTPTGRFDDRPPFPSARGGGGEGSHGWYYERRQEVSL